MKKKQKVFVGMSGGVDSSVTALLLKKKGFDVVGVFIKVWQPDFVECNWQEDRRDAIRVCAELDIPFITLDLEQEYKKGVIDYMIHEYRIGRTPNPDVFCNKEVKFGAFLNWAIKNGADYVATGHYAIAKNQSLYRAKDISKDQSYFLFTLNKDQLNRVIFGIGDKLKSEVREIAEKNNLVVARKKDSQGLCFIGKIEVKDFLKEFIKEKEGDVILIDDNKKQKISTHNGSIFYTIGEKVNGYFVIKKDIKNNILYVSSRQALETIDIQTVTLENVNLIKEIKIGETYELQERYHAPISIIKIKEIKRNLEKNSLEFEYELLSKNNFIYTSGQSLVFYKKNELIGGGIMK